MEPPEHLEGLAPDELEAAAAVGRQLADNVARAVEVDEMVLRSVLVPLAVLTRALGLPPGHGQVVFALGRIIGWIAHAIEQYNAGTLVRPRATYVGPVPPLA